MNECVERGFEPLKVCETKVSFGDNSFPSQSLANIDLFSKNLKTNPLTIWNKGKQRRSTLQGLVVQWGVRVRTGAWIQFRPFEKSSESRLRVLKAAKETGRLFSRISRFIQNTKGVVLSCTTPASK